MNLEGKKNRLKDLQSEAFLSDQEVEEMEKLKEEIQLNTISADEPIEQDKQEEQVKILQEETEKPKKKRKTILRYLIDKYKKKPATWDEIQQLKLEKAKAYLERDIKLAKAQTPSKFAKGLQMLSSLSNNQTTSKKKKSKSSLYESDTSDMIGNTDPDRFKKLVGNNDPNRFKNL